MHRYFLPNVRNHFLLQAFEFGYLVLDYQKETTSASYVYNLDFCTPSPPSQLKRTNKFLIIASNPRKPGCFGVWIWKLVDLWAQEGANSHLTSSFGALKRILGGKETHQGPLRSFRLSLLYQLIIFLKLREALNIWVLVSSSKFDWNGSTGPKISSADLYRNEKAYFTRTS